jgi:hypothetical protein
MLGCAVDCVLGAAVGDGLGEMVRSTVGCVEGTGVSWLVSVGGIVSGESEGSYHGGLASVMRTNAVSPIPGIVFNSDTKIIPRVLSISIRPQSPRGEYPSNGDAYRYHTYPKSSDKYTKS